MAAIPSDIQDRLKGHLIAIARIFKAPRITLILRSPDVGNVTGDLVLGNDNPLYVERALKARVVAEAEILAGTDQKMRVVEKEATPGGLANLEDGGPAENYQPRRKR